MARPALRPLATPSPVKVHADHAGRPLRIVSGRGGGVRAVASVQESWRIDDEWWRAPISRIYHRVVLDNGKLLTLYRDLVEGGWYEQ